MIATYENSLDNTIKSRLAFESLSKSWKRQTAYRSAAISILTLLFVLYRTQQLHSGYSANGIYYPVTSLILTSVICTPVSIFIGWALYQLSIGSRNNTITDYVRSLPVDYFGTVSILIGQNGIEVKSPFFQSTYSWKLITSIKESQGFLFFCSGSSYIVSVPVSAFGNQQTEFITNAEQWLLVSKQDIQTKSVIKDV